ncbi:MAG: hypothetical protein ACU0CI_14330, partial [Shimia sp.]
TAHVVGFDIAAADRAQLQCIADGTGGLYFDASNASGLVTAFDAVAERTAAPEAPEITTLTVFVDRAPSIALPQPLTLTVDGGAVATLDEMTARVNGLPIDLAPGRYVLRAEAARQVGELVVDVTGAAQSVTIPLSALHPDWQLWTEGPFPLDGADRTYLGILASGGAGRDGSAPLYLVRAGETDMCAALDRTSLHVKADAWQFVQTDMPEAAGAYEVVLVSRGAEEVMRLPLSFADTVTPEWRGAREVAPGAPMDLRVLGDWNRTSTFVLSHGGEQVVRASVEGTHSPEGFLFTAPRNAGPARPDALPRHRRLDPRDGRRLARPDRRRRALGRRGKRARRRHGRGSHRDGWGRDRDLGPRRNAGRLAAGLRGSATLDPVPRRAVDPRHGRRRGAGRNRCPGRRGVGVGPTSSLGEMTLNRLDADSWKLLLTTPDPPTSGTMTRDGEGLRGTLGLAIREAPTPVTLLRPGVAPSAAPKPNRIAAVDERGAEVQGPVDWTLMDVGGTEETLRSPTAILYEEARAPGSYTVVARTTTLEGTDIVQVAPGSRGSNRLVLRG